jgi:hypothetical protein
MVDQTDAEFLADIAAKAENAAIAVETYGASAPLLTFAKISLSAIPRLIGMVKAEAERDEVRTDLNDRIEDLSAELREAFAAEKTANLRSDMIARERDAVLAENARLRAALERIEVKQPDGDGLVWVTFTTPHRQFGSFNLGTADKFATKVALEFERLRSTVLAAKE